MNHPNRSKRAPSAPTITPATVSAARGKAGHTQAQAATIVYRTLRSWQQWEGGERRVDPAAFELYLIKTGRWSESKLYAES